MSTVQLLMIILRGLPGSGKNHYIEEQRPTWNKRGPVWPANVVICSADDFFETRHGWKFDPTKLGEAHAACMTRCLVAVKNKIPTIVINNTNAQRWEYANYELIAQLAGYTIKIVELAHAIGTNPDSHQSIARTFFNRQVHGVPEAIFAQMLFRWEPDARAERIYD